MTLTYLICKNIQKIARTNDVLVVMIFGFSFL